MLNFLLKLKRKSTPEPAKKELSEADKWFYNSLKLLLDANKKMVEYGFQESIDKESLHKWLKKNLTIKPRIMNNELPVASAAIFYEQLCVCWCDSVQGYIANPVKDCIPHWNPTTYKLLLRPLSDMTDRERMVLTGSDRNDIPYLIAWGFDVFNWIGTKALDKTSTTLS